MTEQARQSGVSGPRENTNTITRPKLTPLVHAVCPCDETVGLCGKPLRGKDHVNSAIGCVVCADMEWAPCPKCGMEP